MITIFFESWYKHIVALCFLVIVGELFLAPIPVAIPAAFTFMHAWFWGIVILGRILAYYNTFVISQRIDEEHRRRLREKQG